MITSKKSLRNGCSTSPIDNNGRGSSHSESFFCGDVLSANGQVALSGDEYGMLRLWDTAKGETVYSVPSQKSLTFKQQEQERATGKTLLGHTGKVTACALSANGQVALSGDK